jgi:hypothetical protein
MSPEDEKEGSWRVLFLIGGPKNRQQSLVCYDLFESMGGSCEPVEGRIEARRKEAVAGR